MLLGVFCPFFSHILVQNGLFIGIYKSNFMGKQRGFRAFFKKIAIKGTPALIELPYKGQKWPISCGKYSLFGGNLAQDRALLRQFE
jgi:hypothetical protein